MITILTTYKSGAKTTVFAATMKEAASTVAILLGHQFEGFVESVTLSNFVTAPHDLAASCSASCRAL